MSCHVHVTSSYQLAPSVPKRLQVLHGIHKASFADQIICRGCQQAPATRPPAEVMTLQPLDFPFWPHEVIFKTKKRLAAIGDQKKTAGNFTTSQNEGQLMTVA